MVRPSIPEGYITFPEILGILYIESVRWEMTATRLLAALAEYPRDPHDSEATLAVLDEWKNSAELKGMIANIIGVKLASGSTRSAGINSFDGHLVWLPPEVWRMVLPGIKPGTQASAIATALVGQEIPVTDSFGSKKPHFPVLARRELALAFGARRPPPPPKVQPEEIKPPSEGGPEAKKPNGGRPVKHDWDGFWIEVTIWVDLNGLEDSNRSELQKHMQDWFAKRSKTPPDDPTIRGKLAKLYARARET